MSKFYNPFLSVFASRYGDVFAASSDRLPPELIFLYNAIGGGQTSDVGPYPEWSYAGPQYNIDGVSVGTVPALHTGKGIWGGPAYSNLFAGLPTAPEMVALTDQKYCLQVFGAGSITCSYGIATVGTPLVFTASAGFTEFTPTGATLWMVSASGGYVFPYVPPGTSVASAAATSGGNGISWPMSAGMIEALYGKISDEELIIGGDFTSGIGDFYPNTTQYAGSVVVNDSGRLRMESSVGGYGEAGVLVGSFTAGERFVVSVDVVDATSGYYILMSTSATSDMTNRISIKENEPFISSTTIDFRGTATTTGDLYLFFACTTGVGSYLTVDNLSIHRITPSTFTVAALAYMGAGSAEITADANIVAAKDSVTGLIYASSGGILKVTDGTNIATVTVADGWNRDSMLLITPQTNSAGTQIRIGCKKYTSAGVPIDAAIVWGEWATYDGSMNPLTHLRAAYNGTVPLWIEQIQEWNIGDVADADIIGIAEMSGVI